MVIGLPLLWLLSAAFKETSEIYIVPATWIPQQPILDELPARLVRRAVRHVLHEHHLRHRGQRVRQAGHGVLPRRTRW